jgi:hypothetical protein
MLAIKLIDDAPAAPAARPPVVDKPTAADKFDARSINRAACKNFHILYHMIADLRGFPNGEIWRLNPSNPQIDPSRGRRQDGPRLACFSGVDHWNEDGPGAWECRGNGASGRDCISLIQYLSNGCERRVAADYLKSLVDRIVEVPV